MKDVGVPRNNEEDGHPTCWESKQQKRWPPEDCQSNHTNN